MTHASNPQAIGQIVQELTGGKPYVFTIMSYRKGFDSYERRKRIIEEEFGLACLRADDVRVSGHDLLAKIHLLIERAELVVAEISKCGPNEFSPNVFYEVGYAVAKQKAMLVLAEENTEIPTDLKGLELIEYGGSRKAMDVFYDEFRHHLRTRLGARIALLRDMLEADESMPAYILASPKYPGADSRIRGQVYDRRTFGDNLGVVGLLSAFGSILGESSQVELVSAQYSAPNLLDEDINLYVIGSKKVNPLAGQLLSSVQKDSEMGWYLGRLPAEEEIGDYKVHLYQCLNGKVDKMDEHSERRGPDKGIVHTVDHGVIVRAPHPKFGPKRLVFIMAGAHSLGTGAACLAATRSRLIQQISDMLPEGEDLADKTRSIWVLVRGEADDDGMLSESGVTILEAGVY